MRICTPAVGVASAVRFGRFLREPGLRHERVLRLSDLRHWPPFSSHRTKNCPSLPLKPTADTRRACEGHTVCEFGTAKYGDGHYSAHPAPHYIAVAVPYTQSSSHMNGHHPPRHVTYFKKIFLLTRVWQVCEGNQRAPSGRDIVREQRRQDRDVSEK
jgi:hypothetical protein